MPELPEVEVCARTLRRWCGEKVVVEVKLPDPAAVRRGLSTRPSDRCVQGAERWRALVGQRSVQLERHGKRIRWDFDRSTWLLHLGMTGKWVQRQADHATPRFAKLGLVFEDGSVVWFVDPRRFGCVAYVDRDSAAKELVGTMGPDALKNPLDGAGLAQALQGRRTVKNALMDQKKLAGVGNIQAVEALWRAKIDPTRAGGSLSSSEYKSLATALIEQLEWTIAAEDDGEIQYISEKGSENPFQVYGRAGQECARCGGEIVSRKDSGRSTFWCQACQT